jgi:hypothetical protein
METDERKHRKGLIAALLGVALLTITAATALGVTTFSAQVGGTGTFQTGTLLLSKTNAAGTCLSSSNSAGSITTNINAACTGSDLGSGTTNVPQVNQTSTVTLTNQGSINSATGVTLSIGACSAVGAPFGASALNPLSSGSDTAGFCGKVDVTIFSTTTAKCVYPVTAGACPAPSSANTLVTLASASPLTLATSLAAGASVGLTITTQLDASATNADQGLAANATMTYTLGQ